MSNIGLIVAGAKSNFPIMINNKSISKFKIVGIKNTGQLLSCDHCTESKVSQLLGLFLKCEDDQKLYFLTHKCLKAHALWSDKASIERIVQLTYLKFVLVIRGKKLSSSEKEFLFKNKAIPSVDNAENYILTNIYNSKNNPEIICELNQYKNRYERICVEKSNLNLNDGFSKRRKLNDDENDDVENNNNLHDTSNDIIIIEDAPPKEIHDIIIIEDTPPEEVHDVIIIEDAPPEETNHVTIEDTPPEEVNDVVKMLIAKKRTTKPNFYAPGTEIETNSGIGEIFVDVDNVLKMLQNRITGIQVRIQQTLNDGSRVQNEVLAVQEPQQQQRVMICADPHGSTQSEQGIRQATANINNTTKYA
jgi:hypothetical protein